MNKVKVGIIGLGSFGELHLDVLSTMGNIEVVGLVSRSQSRRQELAAKHKVPGTYETLSELIDDRPVDAVFITTEDTRHLEPTLTALRAGLDVFLEKPISPDLTESRIMIDEARKLDRKFMVGHICHFEAGSAMIKQRIMEGDLGDVLTIYGRRNMSKAFQDKYPHSSRLFTTGVHDIDLILWLYEGIQPVEVYMKTINAHGNGDDVFWGMITMENGSLGIVETNWNLPKATPWNGHILLDIVGTQGAALSEIPGNGLTFWTDSAVEVPDTNYWPVIHGITVGALRTEFDYFIHCINNDEQITIPHAEDAYQSIRIAHALLESAQCGEPIKLTPDSRR